ncbi:MAG TPA: aspartate aminotransferase family protein [Candidatus Limnocylindrales bacterium]|nr:aspartate aminotransferase family protein [Candidatus Limnocylindrales bacterium]
MTLVDDYLARTPRSRELFERATQSIPGGSTRTTVFNPPYPPYMVRGAGLRTWDVDGNEYRDFLGNYTSLILGHAHPAVVAAVTEQVRRASAFAAPTEIEIELAEEIKRRLPSVEMLRFTNSGTEATMFAIRAARAFTGRDFVARFDSSYHGTHDTVLPHSAGVPDATSNLVIDLPWADLDGIERGLAGRERQLAAVIIEPVQGAGGVRPADRAFLHALRDMTTEIGAVLIFDEIIAFRIGPNGAQGVFGVTPDLTTLGKIVGGGYALAAFGGRAEIMDRFDARRPGAMSHGGTFNGNPVAAAAGLATLRELTPDRYDRLAQLGGRLRTRLAQGIAAAGIDARVDGIASLFQVFGGPTLAGEGAFTASQTLFLRLLLDGFHLAPRGMGAISTPVTEADVDALAEAVLRGLAALNREPAVV